ncbi:hypothetical protein GA0115255_113143 [Streptomyces sp. Ncost-T6T-2b]|nr:hypothetical protein GA0115255_113143 [Streptomyces sp. Ncost-T6T-2b]
MTQPGSTPNRPRRGAGCLQSLLVLAVILGLGYGASKIFGDESSKSKGSSSSSSSASDGKGGSWEIGDCGGPDPENKPDGYRAFDCDEQGATFKALKIEDASFLPNAIQCPAGTDLIIQVSRVFGSGDGKKGGGIPTNTVCGRNLTGDHPGDAGAGGGRARRGRLRLGDGQGDRLRLGRGERLQGPRPRQGEDRVPSGDHGADAADDGDGPPVRRDLRRQGLTGQPLGARPFPP